MRPSLLVAGGLVLFAGLYTFRLTALQGTVPQEIGGFAVLVASFLVGALFLSAGFRIKRPRPNLPDPRGPS